MAAEVDFGDRELFGQLEGEDESPSPPALDVPVALLQLYERLRDRDETVHRLRAENRELKRKLNILTCPSGISVENSKVDGPLLQILFMNNVISKRYRQEIEDFVFSLVQRYEEQKKCEQEKKHLNAKPQPSSVVLEEDYKTASSSSAKKMKEAFSVVGSVVYFTNFCLDKLGQPILNENPQLTEGWEIPKYQQVFSQILSLDGQEIQVKPKSRPKPHCFNCGSEDHQMKDCPEPRNAARISEKRKEFLEACGDTSNQNFQQRYHEEEVEERFGKFKPGVISVVLQDALGVTDRSLPPFIYRMRQLGYPPGWLKEAEMEHSGLALYDGKGDGDGEDEESPQHKGITYDVSKLVNYPGFNISTPSGIPDEWQIFGSIPMQPSQQKDVFAQYLSNLQALSRKSSNKRAAPQSKSRHSKRQREDSLEVAAADMDLDSDLEAAQRSQTPNSFQFQPPLPPGSPSMSTPPPMPLGTPPLTPPQPSTPTRSPVPRTAPLNPSSDIPQPKIVDSVMDEDTLTLEELEEQQRLIWAALEQAESTNSDSDIPVDTPRTGNSVTSSPSRNEVDLVAEGRSPEKAIPAETGFSDMSDQTPENELSITSPNPGDTLLVLKEDPDDAVSEGMLDNTIPTPSPKVDDGENIGENKVATSTESPAKKYSLVPDMSKFAEGKSPEKVSRVKTEFSDMNDQTPENEHSLTSPNPGDTLLNIEEDPDNAVSEGVLDNTIPPNPEVDDGENTGGNKVATSTESPAKKYSLVPDMSKFAEGITPFEFENMAESTGVYLRIRSVLKNSPRNQQKKKT
ncbi:zinc finger CCHC domain-containing protein 8 isoform X1 [Manacus candei]|uniref:zinc finger CCHC domain-containing protein 8 isoform X1 n=2 Tax=Manacus candei TaxID=415023 RepID=UPI0022268169|nr:zinc finger CCHC domain-containing protein 8 isoform X1 [Manacus candei]